MNELREYTPEDNENVLEFVQKVEPPKKDYGYILGACRLAARGVGQAMAIILYIGFAFSLPIVLLMPLGDILEAATNNTIAAVVVTLIASAISLFLLAAAYYIVTHKPDKE